MGCPTCGRANRAGAKYCAGCATRLAPVCSSCGTELAASAQFCDECGTQVRKDGSHDTSRGSAPAAPTAHAVRKTVTVLFCDLVGSTAFGERVDAESARDVLGRYHAMAQQVIDDHGGAVVKFIGDGVMAVFGVPEVGIDDAERAVAAGLDLQRGFDPIRQLATRRFRTALGLRVGINTGEVVVADHDADMVGDVLNTAARLEAACSPGEVLVGEDTWRSTRATVAYESLGVMEAKGKREGIAMFRALDEVPAQEGVAPFVGRDAELSRLRDVFHGAVTDCEARLATVIGAPGVGKSRLAAEFRRRLGDEARVIDLRLERAGGTTFAPVVDLLEILIAGRAAPDGAGTADSGDVALDRLRHLVADLDDADRVAGLLGAFLGVGPQRSTEELFFAVRRLLEALGRTQPLVVVVDDVQWAEPLLLDLLENAAEWVRDAPVAIVALARPEIRDVRPAFAEAGRRVADTINVEGLDAASTADLAARLVGADSLPTDLVARLPESTEGNPLFVRELMRMLVDDRVLIEAEHGWELTIDADAVDVPPTIQPLLSSRIERLPDDERRLVELAAVVGPDFPLGAVAAIGTEADAGRLLPVLERLRRKELVEPTGSYLGDEPVFRFHHVLIRDAAYRRLLKGTRADLHRRVATWLEESASGATDEQEIAVGFHLEQTYLLRRQLDLTDPETVDIARRGADVLGAAARRALVRDDVAAAGTLLVRAVDMLGADADELPELLLLGCDALVAAGDVSSARPLVERLRSVAGSDGRLAAWVEAFEAQLIVLTAPERLVDAERAAASVADRLAALDDPAGEANARLVRAGALARLGHIGDCEAQLDLALNAARAAADGRRVATVLGAAPVAALWGPSSVSRAGGRCLDVIRLLRITTGSPSVEATATRCQAVLEALRGRFDTSRAMLADARTMVEELGNRRGLLETQLYAGIVELIAGDPAAAEPYLRNAYAGLGRLGIGADAGQAAAHLSRSLLLQGRLEEAAELAADSESLAGQNPQTAIAAKTARAEILAAQGAIEEAVRVAEAAVALAEGTDIVIDHANANLALARVREVAGDRAGARAAAAAADRLLREKGASIGGGAVAAEGGRTGRRPETSAERPTGGPSDEPSDEPWNRADAAARQLFAAFASGDDDVFRRLLAPGPGIEIRREARESYSAGTEVRDFLSADPFDHRSVAETETLAVRGDDLVLMRMRQRPIDDASGLDIKWLAVVRTRADGRADMGVIFDLDEIDAAVEELDRLYLEQEDDVAARYNLRSLTWGQGQIGRLDEDGRTPAFAVNLDASYEHHDHRRVGWGVLERASYVDRLLTLESFDGPPRLVTQRQLGLGRSVTWNESRLEVPDPSGSMRIDIQENVTQFGPSGLRTRIDQYGSDQIEEARARFEEACADVQASGQLWNVASSSGAAVNTWAAAGRWDLVADWVADDIDLIGEHGEPVGVVGGVEPLRAVLGVEHRDVLAIRGERLVLSTRWDDSGHEPVSQLAVEEVDRDGRLARIRLFPIDALPDARRHLVERWQEVDAPEPAEPVATAERFNHALGTGDFETVRALATDAFVVVDHRPLSFARLAIDDLAALAGSIEEEHSRLVESEVVQVRPGGIIGRSNVWRLVQASRWEEAGVPFLGVVTVVDGLVAGVDLFPEGDLDAARAILDDSDDSGADEPWNAAGGEADADELWNAADATAGADEPWNAADAKARRLLDVMVGRDIDEYRALLADDVHIDDRRPHVHLRVEGAEAVVEMRRPRVFPPDAELVGVAETVACRGDDLVLRAATFREADRTDGPSVEILTITSWDGDLLRGVTIFDPHALADAIAALDQMYLERTDDVWLRMRLKGSAEMFGAIVRADIAAALAQVDDDYEWLDHRPLGWGRLDREQVAQRWETISQLPGGVFLYESCGGRHDGPVEWAEPHVRLTDADGRSQLDTQICLNVYDPVTGLMSKTHQFGREQRADAERMFAELGAESHARGDLWNPAVAVGGRVNSWARVGDLDRIDSWTADEATIEGAADLRGLPLVGGLGIGAARRRVLAVRGERLALTELRDAFGDEGFQRLAVEEVDGDGRLVRIALFPGADLSEAKRHVEERCAAVETAEHAEVARVYLRFLSAFTSRSTDELQAVTTDDFSFVDHRPLSYATLDRDGLCDLIQAVEDEGSDTVIMRVVAVQSDGSVGRMCVWRRAASGEWEEGGVPSLVVFKLRGRYVSAVHLFSEDDLARARRTLASSPARSDADEPIETFPDDQLEDARARFEAMTAEMVGEEPTSRGGTAPWNDADRWSRQALTGGDVRDLPDSSTQASEVETVATRGDRLVVVRLIAHGPGGEVTEHLLLHEWSTEAELLHESRYEGSELSRAIAELDRRYVAHEPGTEVVAFLRYWRSLSAITDVANIERALGYHDTEFRMVDHRPLGWPVQDLPGLRRRFESIAELGAGAEVHMARTARSAGPVQLSESAITQWHGPGSRTTTRSLLLSTRSADSGLLISAEQFHVDDVEEAISRFDEVVDEWRSEAGLSNAASRLANAAHSQVCRGLTDLAGELVSPDLVVVDSSGVVPITAPERRVSAAGLGAQNRRVLAVRGERLALMAWSDDDLGGEVVRRFAVVEVDHQARIHRLVLFDWSHDGLVAAADLLDERWLEIEEVDDHDRLGSELVRGMRHRDRDALASVLAGDFAAVDRRTLGWPDFDREQWLDLFQQHEDPVVTVVGEIVDATAMGIAVRMSQWSLAGRELDEALPGLFIALFRDARVVYAEGQASGDPADALARLAELTGGAGDERAP